jgi:CubicO group peptidase (beta-lactamase class C family)
VRRKKSGETVRKVLEGGMREGVFPGAVLLVAREGEVVFFEATGNRSILAETAPMKRDTIFDLASLTKPLATTVAFMKLVDTGRVGLDQPISELIEASPLGDKKDLTPRLLLNHSAGLVDWKPYYLKLVEFDPRERKKVLRDSIIQEPFVYKPGEGNFYSDLGFMLLEWVIEEREGESMPQVLDRYFYGPLGLKRTFFVATREGQNPPQPPFTKGGGGREGTKGGAGKGEGGVHDTTEAADSRFCGNDEEGFERGNKGYSKGEFAATENCPWRKEIIQGVVHDENAYAVGGYSGHAGLFGTAEEVHVLVNLLREHYPGKRNDYLKPETVREFFTRQNIAKESTWALGWDTPTSEDSSSGRYFSENSVGHLGFTGTSIWMDLEKNVIVILLTNRLHPTRNNERIKAFRPKIHDAVMGSLNLD